jgi:serine/threonine-protein kinase HipA
VAGFRAPVPKGVVKFSLAGVRTGPFQLIERAAILGVPTALILGDHALAVERFDRPQDGRRVHIEDMAQIRGAVGDQNDTRGNSETVLRMIQRFSSDWRGDVLEGFRRLVVDVLLGNGDETLALPFAGVRKFSGLSLHQFDRVAAFLRLDPAWIRIEVKTTVRRALDTWPAAMAELPLSAADRDRLVRRWATVTLVAEARA